MLEITLWLCSRYTQYLFNSLSANPMKWPNTLKQFVSKLPTNCLSVFDHFVGLALKGLIQAKKDIPIRHIGNKCSSAASIHWPKAWGFMSYFDFNKNFQKLFSILVKWSLVETSSLSKRKLFKITCYYSSIANVNVRQM